MFKQLNEYLDYTIEEGVFIVKYKHQAKVGLDEAKKIVLDRLKLFNGQEYPVMITGRAGNPLITKTARDYLATSEGMKGCKAIAIVMGNLIFEIMGNIFINFSRPKIEIKIFSNE
jgi:hypothetical protein